jgi:predicted metalloprotease with PDZ domain
VCTREIDGKAVQFGTSGYTMDHVFVLYDRATGSVWYPLGDKTLDAVAGAKRGDSIDFLSKPSPQPLSTWLEKHPGSEVLLPTEQDLQRLQRMSRRAYLGVQLEPADVGLTIAAVSEGSPAAAAGLRQGDVIRQIAGQRVEGRSELQGVLRQHEAGDAIEVVVDRGGREVTIDVTLGSRR